MASLLACGCAPPKPVQSADRPARDAGPPASTAEPASSYNLSGAGAATYLAEHAKARLDAWLPLTFTGELKPYDPADFPNPAFHEFVDKTCGTNAIWQATAAFDERMEELPIAVSTPQGAVLYQRERDKYVVEDRQIYVGVRISDRTCGAFERGEGTLSTAGDADVVATLIAAAAIKGVDPDADRRTLTFQTQTRAADLIPGLLGAPAAGPSTERVQQPKRPYHFELLCSGADSLLTVPLEASYRVNTQDSTWWICFAENDCGEPQKIELLSDRLIVFERSADVMTVWRSDTGRLDSVDRRAGMQRHLACRLQPLKRHGSGAVRSEGPLNASPAGT